MNLSSLSLAESLKELVQALEVRFLFPSILFVTFNLIVFSREHINIMEDIKILNEFSALFLVMVVIIFGYVLSSLNGVIIRTIEGYTFNISFLKNWEKKKLDKLNKEIDKYKEKSRDVEDFFDDIEEHIAINKHTPQSLIKLKELLNTLNIEYKIKIDNFRNHKDKRFPDNELLMTPIGNVIAAFEHYPYKRYGIDSVALWPRLYPILERKKFLSIVQKERVTFDFLLNSSLVFFLILIESYFILIYIFFTTTSFSYFYFLSMSTSFILICLFLYGAFNVAKDWGTLVSTAFDLYRDDLRKSLKITSIPTTLDDEKKMWKSISRFIKHSDDKFDRFYLNSDKE